ncbi:MAG TPA: type VI secretion system membrane subunit TssM, partial [Albitalea sp.]|nr:type VI secretion system membrane subunit TssM [Albitalea sp.]
MIAANPTLTRTLLSGLGLLAALALVWYLGPLLAIGGVAPLAGAGARGAALAAVAALAIGIAAWRAAQSARTNRQLLDGMAESADEAEPGAQEVAVIGERFERAVGLLKRRRAGAKRSWRSLFQAQPYVYELPWYVIIGAPGAGKTTALINSGLEFPLEAQLGRKMIRGIGGTRNCDWWFATDAVLIDTAGRYTTHDSHQAADRGAWLGFLDLLVRYRPGRPINGVLLTINIQDLLQQNPNERKEHAAKLRARMQELAEKLGVRAPVYVLVTKADLIAGFNEMFGDLGKEDRNQVWGFSFPYAPQGNDDP